MAAGNEMRVSDAEREAAAAELQEHFAAGRLDQEELNERLAAAFAAKTRGDLNAVFTDLPSSGPSWSDAGRPPHFAAHGFGPDGPNNPEPGWTYRRRYGGWYGKGPGPGERAGAGIAALLGLVPVLAVLGVVSLLTLGHGRPFGIVLILAAVALLRRLLFLLFGWRRRGGRGPRRAPRRHR